jgi:uncharacterized protein
MTTIMDAATAATPVTATERIHSLDVLRGFALLGILLLNILGFGLHSAGYFNPLIGIGETELSRTVNLSVWATVSVLFEGAMRALFSMLFGAGVVLFTSGGRRPALHFKRNFWLLLFGIVDAYLLLWSGDILITYAIVGAILFGMRNWSPRKLFIAAAIVIVGMSLFYLFYYLGLSRARETGGALWLEFFAENSPSAEVYQQELEQRRSSYAAAFDVNLQIKIYMTLFVLPVILIWDALAMMLIGMALFKMRVLDASRSTAFYQGMMLGGFALGLSVNLWELAGAVRSDFDLLASVPIVAWSYHFGRIGMAMGYLGLIMLMCKSGAFAALRRRLAAVGRMALTNYLSHSVICLFLFTGAGLGLVGVLERWELYLVVFAIWAFQLWFSPWWLQRYRFGPMEWLWRRLTYGK